MSNPIQSTNRYSTPNIVGTERIRTDFGGQYIAHDGITLIFSHLTGLRDLVSFASASRGLYQHYLHSFQWDSFVQKYFPDSYKDWQCDLQPNLLSGLQGRGFYKQLMSTRKNIATGKYRLLEMKEGSCGWIEGLGVHGNDFYLKGSSGTVKVFDLEKRKERRTFNVPGSSIDIFCIDEDVLYVGLENEAKIIAFDLKSGKEIGLSFQGPLHGGRNKNVSKICADKNYLCATFQDSESGEVDADITVWHLENGKEDHISYSQGYDIGVHDFCIHEGNLYAGFLDGLIEVFALESGQQIQTLQNDQEETDPSIFYLRVDDGYLHSCSEHGTFKIWDLKSGNELQKIQLLKDFDDHRRITCLYEHNHFIYFGCTEGIEIGQDLPNNGAEMIRDLNVYDLINGQTYKIPCFLEPAEEDVHSFQNLYMHKDHLFVRALQSSSLKTLSFSFPPSHNNFLQILEKNLNILEKMKEAIRRDDFETVTALAKTLHPRFRDRLQQYCFKTILWPREEDITLDAVICASIEMNVEKLLHAVHFEDSKMISQVLNDLESKDPSCVVMLCHFLEMAICGQVQSEDERSALQNREIWDLASRVQKEKAVNAYKQILKQKWGEDFSFQLINLHIVYPDEYSRKLGCPSEHLSKIGVLSPGDLNILGISCPPPLLEKLQIDAAVNIGTDPRTTDFARKKAISEFLQTLLNHVNAKVNETNNFSVLLYDKGNPWSSIQQALITFQTEFTQIVESSTLPKDFSIVFSLEACQTMAKRLNGYADSFHKLDCQHQIAKLHAYINQVGILKAWKENYRPQRIYTLTELAARSDVTPNFYQMGI